MRFGLDRMRRLLTALGSPQERFASIHVVGTNGKSSTVADDRGDPARHGLRTGAYLSPHLVSFAERVRIDDADVAGAEFAAAVAARRGGAPRRSTARRPATTTSRSSRLLDRGRARRAGARPASTSRWSRPGSAGATTPPT